MRIISTIFIALLLQVSTAHAAGSGFGLNVGTGLPYVSQFGVNWVHSSGRFSAELSQQSISLSADTASVSLSKPEINVKWHPFSGSFFLGAGVGQQTLKVVGTDALTSATATAELNATTTSISTGWMWGAGDGGFFAGMDASYIMPSGGEVTITTTLPTTNEAYQDAETQAEKFGTAAYVNITLLRLGYLF